MTRSTTIMILLGAALLEAVGDTVMRLGLSSNSGWRRYCMFLTAAVVLFAYGWVVNAPPWNFGQLLGLYVVFFFVIAQLLSWIVFKQVPSPSILLGGGLILAGGIVIAVGSGSL